MMKVFNRKRNQNLTKGAAGNAVTKKKRAGVKAGMAAALAAEEGESTQIAEVDKKVTKDFTGTEAEYTVYTREGAEYYYDGTNAALYDADGVPVDPFDISDYTVVRETVENTVDTVKEVPILYSVTEDMEKAVTSDNKSLEDLGYSSKVTAVVTDDGKGKPGEYEIINSRDRDKTEVTVIKTWNDENEALRPQELVVTLTGDGVTKLDGRNTELTSIITADDGWTYTFTGLPKNKDGSENVPITYKVKEIVPDHYTAAYSATVGTETKTDGTVGTDGKVTITNTLVAQKVNVKVEKIWYDPEGNVADKAPVAATIWLVKNIEGQAAEDVESWTIAAGAEGDDLKHEWTDLPAMVGGKPVTYTVREDIIPGYMEPSIESRDGKVNDYIVKNYKVDDNVSLVYIDPLSGKMVVAAATYGPDAIDGAVKNLTGKPADPSHDNYVFTGWKTEFVEETGNWIAVAQYKPPQKTVTFIDGRTGKSYKTETSDDPSSVTPPTPAEHENMKFAGWVKETDANGNVIYTAAYAPDCKNSGSTVVPGNSGRTNTASGGKVAPANTGDANTPLAWIGMFGVAAFALALAERKRRRG